MDVVAEDEFKRRIKNAFIRHSVVAENDFIRRMPLSGIPAFGRENRKPRVFFDAWYGVNPEHEDSKN